MNCENPSCDMEGYDIWLDGKVYCEECIEVLFENAKYTERRRKKEDSKQ